MAMTQASSDKKTVGMITEKDAGGFVYTAIGGVRFYSGQGVPNHTTVKGSIYVDTASGKMYIATAVSTWAVVGSQS